MLIRTKTILFCTMLLSACIKSTSSPYYASENDKLRPYPQSVSYYTAQAESTVDPIERNQLLLSAAGRMIADGLSKRATQLLNRLSELTSSQQDEKYLLEAKLSLLKKRPQTALNTASKIATPTELTPAQQGLYHEMLASAYSLSGQTLNQVAQLIDLDNLQTGTNAKLATRQKIWQVLSSMPLSQEQAVAVDASGELEGWLSLNITAKSFRDNGEMLLNEIKNWQQQHPTHPANDIVMTSNEALVAEPEHIALLLPLSGPLSGPGQAVRDGFMADYFAAKAKGKTVRFYDTNQKNIAEVYQSAVSNGADFIIGPLKKTNVQALADQSLPVPTLALNDIDTSSSKTNFYQFSIDPQNEANQLAHKVYGDGLRRAVVIAPKGKWGESIANTFISQWQAKGGELADVFYFEDKTNFKTAIRDLLDVSDSYDRKNDLVRTIWKQPKFYPRRRQDFDVVVLLSYASQARQIRPMLKFYFAGDLPVYGTSLLYSGKPNPQFDSDLNGVIFGDMPYLLSNPKNLNQKTWPEQFNSYNRLYAMGKDAFLLTNQMNQLKMFPLMGMLDNTGTLFIKPNGQVVRQLKWAQFEGGRVKPLLG